MPIKFLLFGCFGLLLCSDVNSQTFAPIEYSLPLEVTQRIDEFVNSIDTLERGTPFLKLRAGWNYGENSEIAVKIGAQHGIDSLLLSQQGRNVSGTNYRIAFAGEALYGTSHVEGSHAMFAKCLMEEESMFVITFRETPKTKIVRTRFKPVWWCVSK